MAAQFDGVNLIITLDAPTNGVLNQTAEQVYDDAKQWHLNANNRKYPFPFTTSGGEPITTDAFAGQYYFLRNDLGWRIRSTDADQDVYWDGNLIPTDLLLPIIEGWPARTILHLGLQPIVQGLSLLADVHGQVRRAIYINTEGLVNGNGYQQSPYNNWTDGVDDAEARGLQTLYLEADAVIDRQLRNFEIFGIDLPQVDLNSQSVDGSVFRLCKITGTQAGTAQLIAFDCQLTNVTDFNGAASLVGAIGTIAFRNGGASILNQLVPFTTSPVTLDFTLGGAATTVEANNVSGDYIIANMDAAGDVLHLAMDHGEVTIAASCTAGTIKISGSCLVTDNSAGTTVDVTQIDHELVFSHQIEGTETMNQQMRLLRAAAAGNIVQQPDGSYVIRSADNLTDRITGDDAANSGRTISGTDTS
jgi:hypothetical protein